MTSRPKVLAIASAGGHWVQMRLLAEAALGEFDVAFVSTIADLAESVPGHRFYRVIDVTRRNPLRVLVTGAQLISVLVRERPKVVITTGALPGLLGLVLGGKLMGAKTVWLDSIANCETISSSGRQARRFADKWLTQWPELANNGGPEYWGSLL